MRGNPANYRPQQFPAGATTAAGGLEVANNYVNAEETQPKITLTFILSLLAVYFIWDIFIQKNKKVSDVIEPGNIRTNFYNLLAITLGVVIGVNLFKVLFVKLAALEIPGLSWLAKRALPLLQF